MKKIANTLAMLVILIISAKAQPTLSGSISNTSPGFFYHVTLAMSGDKYVQQVADSGYRAIIIYNNDCSVWRTIDLSALPAGYWVMGLDTLRTWHYSLSYVSENLFSLTGEIEALVSIQVGGNNFYTCIVNESGSIVWDIYGQNPIFTTSFWYDGPVYTTSTGVTEMILFGAIQYPSGKQQAYIYRLPGTITDTQPPLIGNGNGSLNSFPNPTSGPVTIKYELPTGVNFGQIVLYDMSGKILKSYQVDNTSNNLETSALGLKSGNYLWQLKSGNYKTTQKMIVVK